MDGATIHNMLGEKGWPRVLASCGVPETYLKNKHGPCPACGGKDRFRFDNKGLGRYFCSHCGAGDGFSLIMKIAGCTFPEAMDRVLIAEGLDPAEERRKDWKPTRVAAPSEPEIARPTYRVRALLKETCAIEDCDAAVDYLDSRCLWPLPASHQLRAHPSVEYWEEGQSVGRFPALVTAIRNRDGELVTAHVTYLTPKGEKLSEHDPRKILTPMTGHIGCAARIMPMHEILGIAEGIETALSATKLLGVPTWAALNTSLLSKFEPPDGVKTLVIFADSDVAGLTAASKLMQKLQTTVHLEFRAPPMKDWNDLLRAPA